MKKIILICFLGALAGCALGGGTTGKISGTDLKTAYGSGDGSITIRSQHCWSLFYGKCDNVDQTSADNSTVNGITNTETINDSIERPTTNPAK